MAIECRGVSVSQLVWEFIYTRASSIGRTVLYGRAVTDHVRPENSFLRVPRSSASRPDDAEHRRTLKSEVRTRVSPSTKLLHTFFVTMRIRSLEQGIAPLKEFVTEELVSCQSTFPQRSHAAAPLTGESDTSIVSI